MEGGKVVMIGVMWMRRNCKQLFNFPLHENEKKIRCEELLGKIKEAFLSCCDF